MSAPQSFWKWQRWVNWFTVNIKLYSPEKTPRHLSEILQRTTGDGWAVLEATIIEI